MYNYLVSAYKDESFFKNIAINPLTEEAKKWVERHLSVEWYESLFGEVPE